MTHMICECNLFKEIHSWWHFLVSSYFTSQANRNLLYKTIIQMIFIVKIRVEQRRETKKIFRMTKKNFCDINLYKRPIFWILAQS